MALTLEDGTGVTGADSFVTVETCSAHAVAYFGASLAGSEADKEAALRRAWVYMSALTWNVDLWPIFGGTIPEAVKIAQSVFARAEFKNPNFLSPSEALSGRKVLSEVKGIKWDVQGAPATIEAMRPVVTMGFDLLKPYLMSNPAKGGGVSTLLRM